ncbi:MAG: Hsp70 family protein, partial [Terriglobales bacterium]
LQGERPMAAQNRTLGKFHLIGIPAAPRGVPQIEVTFDIDANGIVNVSAKDLGTGKEQKITITSSSGLSKEEIDRMTKEAEAHADEDKRRREEVEARNQLDSLVYNTDKMLKENREKVSTGDAEAVEAGLAEARQALDGSDVNAMNTARDRLTAATHKLAEAMYKSASSQPGGGAAGAGTPPPPPEGNGQAKEGEVIDAEYVDADAEKRN